MSGETNTLRLNIDASQAKRGSAAYVAAIGKIAQATRDFDKLAGQLGKSMSKSGSFNAIARELAKLNSMRLNPSIAKNVGALSQAMSGFRGPSAASVKNLRAFMREISSARVNPSLAKNVGAFAQALSSFKGPSRSGVSATQQFIKSISASRINPNVAQSIASISNALNNFKGPGAQAARNVQMFAQALSQIRVPAGLTRIGAALSNLNSRFGSSANGAIRLGGSVNGIPWGRASAGAIQLTGNLRGLENAMSLSYQMGSQLRTLFGALTISGFTSSVVEATSTADRLRYLLGAVAEDTGEVANMMNFAGDAANKYGLDLLEVQKQFGRFSAGARSTGLSVEQTQFAFEGLASQMRLFGLDSQQQSRAMMAITQMFQKGAVQAEEFKTQLGEQLPVFEAMRRAMAKVTGDENVDIMKMMEQGMIGSDAVILMLLEMEELFGKGIPDALKNPLVGMQNLKNAWTEFLVLVGSGGVMEALGDVSWALTDIMRSADFQAMAKDIAEGLGNAIRKAGAAAEWLLLNIREVGKVLAIALGAKAVGTALQLASAFGSIGGSVFGLLAPVGMLMQNIKGLVGLGRGITSLGPIIAGLGGAFGLAAIAGGAALALLWNETVKVGDTTTTVGKMAVVAFQDFGNWAQWAGQMLMTLFEQAGVWAGDWFNAMNQEVTQGSASWEDWAKAVIGAIVLVGATMGDVFRLAWRLVVQNTLDAFSIIMNTVKGINAAFQMVGALTRFDTQTAAAWAGQAATFFGEAGATGEKAFKETFLDGFVGTLAEAEKRTNEYLAGVDWLSTTWDGNRESAIKYFEEVAKRSAMIAPETPEAARAPYTAPSVDTTGLDPLNKDYDTSGAGKSLDSVAKRAKEAAKAFKDFKAESDYLDAALSSNKITLDQYAESMNYIKGELEKVVDPYAAMVRTMQEENNVLRLNGKEQRLASSFIAKKNELLEQGIALTAQQTAELQKLIAEQDKLNNPSPLQAWVDGMAEFGDAIENAGVKAMEGLSDSLADLVVDGKADWASLAKTILKDLIKIGLNEVWKNMFGGANPAQAVNAPLTGASGAQALTDLNTPANNAAVMAGAVAQGIQMAGGGFLGNDIGAGAGPFSGLQSMMGNKSVLGNDIGAGAGSFAGFQSAMSGKSGGGSAGAVGLAESMLGMTENGNNADINAFLKKGGVDIDAAQTAWCAGFVNASLEQVGVKGSGSLVANDFLKWGQGVNPADVMRGDVMVKNNGLGPGQTGGHVGFATGKTRMGENGMEMEMLSGNSADKVKYDWYSENQVQLRRAMEQQQSPIPPGGLPGTVPGAATSYSQAGMSPQLGGMLAPGMMQPGMQQPGMVAQPVPPSLQPSMAATGMGAGGFAALPGGMAGGSAMGMGGAMGGNSVAGLGEQIKAEVTPAFQDVATQIPQQFDPAMNQVAQQLPMKFTQNTEGMGEQLLSAAQPGNLQAAQDNAQKYQEANTQAANDFAMKMQSASSMGAGGGIGGALGGGGGGGLGGMMGMLGPILGSFFENGGVVGKSGGSSKSVGGASWANARSMKFGGIVGDPDAEPIIAHKGELVTPAHEVDRMRRMGVDAALIDNAAVKNANTRRMNPKAGGEDSDGTGSGNSSFRGATPRPIVNMVINTPNADSFRASQGQIHAKAGAAAYRDAVRNH